MKNTLYGIGLDIGVASVGWAVVGLNGTGEPVGLHRLGVRIFDKAEQPKTGESLAAPRRMARGMRRRLRRKALRRADVYALLERSGLSTREALAQMFEAGGLEDIYALRTRALDEPVGKAEFSRILLHLAQRRGFKSNRRTASDGEDGRLLAAVNENRRRMAQGGWRTVGEMLYRHEAFALHKRNKADDYLSTVGRDMVAEEASILFERQRAMGCSWAAPELQAEYLSILLRQRSFDEGPGGNSPYGGNQVEKMVGRCTFEPDEPRAAKAAYSFEYFSLLQKLNHICLAENGETRPLTQPQRQQLLSLAHKTPDISLARIRKELALPETVQFNGVRCRANETLEESEKKEKFACLPAYHKMRKALDGVVKGRISSLSISQRDAAATALSLYKNEDTLRAKLTEAGFQAPEIDALAGLTGFSKFGHLSLKACRKLIPHLEQGLTYDQACSAAGYDFKGHGAGERAFTLPAAAPEMEQITSPVVRRAVAQTIKVVNGIIREMDASPAWVRIELARELSKTFGERQEMDRSMRENAAKNERLMQELRDTFHLLSPTGQDLVKYRLWKEQDGVCAYSLRRLDVERLFEPGYVDVDHIVPYSLSFDDRRSNKVLVLSSENRQKGNRLPLQYLQGKRREDFIVWTNSSVRDYRKRQNLLREKLSGDEAEGFRQRNLQDTQHMARFLYNYISDHLAFAQSEALGKKRVFAVSGAVTSHLRKRWGLSKVRADGDLHHALDAAVIACTTDGMIRRISGYYGHIEGEYLQDADGAGSQHARTKERFPAPWPRFRDELIVRLSEQPGEHLLDINPGFYCEYGTEHIRPVFVSRMPRRKVTGPGHKETIKGAAAADEGLLTVRKALTELKLDKDGEIKDYYMPSSDTLLYEALKAQLRRFGGDSKKAFAEPFYKPKADGTPGPLVRKVKTIEKATLTVPVHGGAASNDTMVRVDVFLVPGDGYYWVPVYVADTLKPELPNRAVAQGKPYSEWKEMREEDFIFSLYPNDLVYAEHKSGLKFTLQNADSTLEKTRTQTSAFAYFVSGSISTASITIRTHDNAYGIPSLGVKTLKTFHKYQVDVLGNVFPVHKETRQKFR